MAKKKKNFIYDGLGFPIVLSEVTLRNVRGQWHPVVDVEAVADLAFEALARKPVRLTGNEVKFIRTHLNLTKAAFGELFGVSHVAVIKWERAENSPAPMMPGLELQIRLYIGDCKGGGADSFYDLYKKVQSSIYDESDTPIEIAV